jgi:plasmid stabilization system protein ParE
MEVAWTQHALDALEEVFQFGSRYSQDRAVDYVDQLIDFCDTLVPSPKKFPACPELPHPDGVYRSAVFDRRYRIIYRIAEADEKVYVLDVFHTSRNPKQIKRLRDVE